MPGDVGAQPRPAPAVVIRIPFEGSPRVLGDYVCEADELRMLDWLQSRPQVLALIRDALELQEAA
jgi:hypothetical protein